MPRTKKVVTPTSAVKTPGTVEPIVPQFQLSPEEMQAVLTARAQVGETKVGVSELAQALITAIETTRPPSKKSVFTRKKGDPWQPKDGSAKLKFKRAFYQHGIKIDEDQLTNENIALLNQLKPGRYCEGWVRVEKRKDGGYNLAYPVKTAAQRMKLSHTYGITSFGSFIQRLLDEKANPVKYRKPEDDDEDA